MKVGEIIRLVLVSLAGVVLIFAILLEAIELKYLIVALVFWLLIFLGEVSEG